MLEYLLAGLASSALLVGGILVARRQRKIRLARRHRERLLALIGLREDALETSNLSSRHWWEHFKTRLLLK
jgi:hypothetical protein